MSGPSAAGASEDRSLNDSAKNFLKADPGLTGRSCGALPGAGLTTLWQNRKLRTTEPALDSRARK
tara:strand:- start:2786 stop:2980 length:195 start_codon:yes stop_codon:yes gene_type:complete